MKFKNVSGLAHNTIHANYYEFHEELNDLIQSEHPEALDIDQRGRLALLGIRTGYPFRPDEKLKQILNETA